MELEHIESPWNIYVGEYQHEDVKNVDDARISKTN